MRFSRRTLAGIGVIGALALSVPALAQDRTDDPAVESTQDGGADEGEDRRTAVRERFAEELASELGLPPEQVEAALEAVHERLHAERRAERLAALEERLDEAVAEGALTREQADAILAAAEAGVLPGGRGRWHRHGAPGGLGRGLAPDVAPAVGTDVQGAAI